MHSRPPPVTLTRTSGAAPVRRYRTSLCAWMGAHRRRIIRQRSTANSRRRGAKSSDVSSLAGEEDNSSCGSWPDADGTDRSSRTFTHGTLIRHTSVARGGGHWVGRGGSRGAGTTGCDTGDQPTYHPEAECSQRAGFVGSLSSSHEVSGRVIGVARHPVESRR